MKNILFSLAAAVAAVAIQGSAMAQDTITFQGGALELQMDLNLDTNWLASDGVTPGFPVTGDTGIIDVDSTFPGTQGHAIFQAGGDLIFGGGATLTAPVDVVASVPDSITFNDVTLNVDDDIFTGSADGNYIFNAGSVTNVDDDFEANAGGTITVNGGTHTTDIDSPNTGNFGCQRGSTLNFLGGAVNTGTGSFRTQENETLFATVNVGGDATLTAATIDLSPQTAIDFSSAWTGSLTGADQSGTSWQATLTATAATFNGTPIDATVFTNNFQLTNGGTTLSLIAPVSVILGDVNMDGTVDFLDISPFIAVLSSGGDQAEADINQDTVVDFLDISPFIGILSGSGS